MKAGPTLAILTTTIIMALLPCMADATVTTTAFSVSYTCTGSTGPYWFTFPISSPAAMTVTQNGTALASTAYTIASVNNNYENGGNVTLNSSCPSGQTLVLQREVRLTQTALFNHNMPVPVKTDDNNICVVDGVHKVGLTGLNSCIGSFSTLSPGYTFIPSNTAATSLWNAPSNGSLIFDSRFANDNGLMEGTFPYAHSHWLLDLHAGANDPYESNDFSGQFGLSINTFADGGGASGNNAQANAVSLFAGMKRASASNRPVWAANFNTSYESGASKSSAHGIEVDLNNSGGSNDTNNYGVGVHIISGGGTRGNMAGTGDSTGAGGPDSWENDIVAQSYNTVGLTLENQSSGRIADIYVVPPANDANLSYVSRNASNTSTVYSVDDRGDIYTQGTMQISNPTSESFLPIMQFMAPNLTAGQVARQFFGKALSNNNSVVQEFIYSGPASASNEWTLGLYGNSNIISFTGNGVFQSTYFNPGTAYDLDAHLIESATAPSIRTGFGTSPSISAPSGTAAFRVTIGTGGTATSGVLTMPTASNGWNCFSSDQTTPATNYTKQSASSKSSVTLTNYNSSGTANAWSAGDLLIVNCTAF
jgi:hypothetical protein